VGILGAIPIWTWIVIAALAFGAWNKHSAKRANEARAQAELAAESARIQQRGTAASLTETTRRIEAQSKVNRNASTSTARARAAAAAAAGAAGGLRAAAIGAAASSAAACHSTLGRDSEASRLADVLVEVVDEYREVAAAADRAVIAGNACQQSYEALTAAPAAEEPP
jgi:hypothetical protein